MKLPHRQVASFLMHAGLLRDPSEMHLTALTGGVASDIWKVEAGGRRFVVKRALAKLRVAQHWEAPVTRNGSEMDWLVEAGRIVPGAVPRVLAGDRHAGMFAMAYLDPENHPVWKSELRAGRADPIFAAKLGRTIAAIHGATAGSADIAKRFANDATFHSIRIEPYLEATARVHPDLAGPLTALARKTLDARRTLVHGDVSPKNILVGPDGPVILDAECAWYGEPAFDVAFCLNHLLLKCLWKSGATPGFLASFDALAAAYLGQVGWETPVAVEARIAGLLPALFLARVDGKSPVEYITEDRDKDRVRRIARGMIVDPPQRLAVIREAWAQEMSA